MNEQYKTHFTLPQNLYAEGAPLIIMAGALHTDHYAGRSFIHLKFKNLSAKPLKLLKVLVSLYDVMDRPYKEPIEYQYIDGPVRFGSVFGTQTPIYLSDHFARSFSVSVLEVGFEDGTIQDLHSASWEPLPAQSTLEEALPSPFALKAYRTAFRGTARFVPNEYKGLRRCTCGELSLYKNPYCSACGANFLASADIQPQELLQEGIYLSACELAENDTKRNLEKAIPLFEELGEYKDAPTRVADYRERLKSRAKRRRLAKKISLLSAIGVFTVAVLVFTALFIKIASQDFFTFQERADGTYEITDLVLGNPTSLVIPDSYNGQPVTTISADAFRGAKELTSITIPDGVIRIGKGAFADCTGLTSLTLPASVTSIDENAFADCTALSSVTICSSAINLHKNAFSGCTEIRTATIPTDAISSIPRQALESVTITAGTSIPQDAFSDCTRLTSVTLPDTITVIGKNAFANCTALAALTLPDGVTSIGYGAFQNCTALTAITLPESVKTVDAMAFAHCTSLASVEISDGVASIGYGAFQNCTALTAITLPESVKTVDAMAFAHCTSLASVEISDGVASIGYGAFQNCTALTAVTLPESVKTVDAMAFAHCMSLSSIILSPNLEAPGDDIFEGCSLLKTVTAPTAALPFLRKASLETLVINGGSVLAEDALIDCTALRTIEISDSITHIGENAFADCQNLTSIRYSGNRWNWSSIKKDTGWDEGLSDCKIYCSNGVINIG